MVYRDIKFKALSIQEVVIFGYYYKDKRNNKEYILTDEGYKYQIKPNTVCQYIGLNTLKSNEEIYEGDVIYVNNRKFLVEPIGCEEQDGNQYGLCVSLNGNGINGFIDSSILKGKVIGNIFIDGDCILN